MSVFGSRPDVLYTLRSMSDTHVALIGAGPIGLELAVALKQAGIGYTHFEAGQIGQTVFRYPKMTRFYSSPQRIAIAGVPLYTSDQSKATREEYLAYLRNIVEQFDLAVHTFERVTAIERCGGDFTLRTDCHGAVQQYQASNIVLAVGDMAHPRLLHIPGEDLTHVSHYFDEPHRYFRKKLLIIGGKNSAVEAAIRCHRAGAKVAVSYRGDRFDPDRIKYWLLPEIEALIRAGEIDFYINTVPRSISSTHVTLHPAPGCIGDPLEVQADFVLLLTGYAMDTTLFEMAGVELAGENQAPIHDPGTMATNVPGIYVAGTAAAGTQVQFKLFIENCHCHIPRIVAALTGQPPPPDAGAALKEHTDLES